MKRTKTINQKDYTYYTCEVTAGGIKINEGWVDRDDAITRLKEQKEEGHTEGLTFKVYSFAYLASKGIYPWDDCNWGNPSYIK